VWNQRIDGKRIFAKEFDGIHDLAAAVSAAEGKNAAAFAVIQ
jgi:hypothetical protein